jgi:RNA polymerase sigma-70 factor (ECF subfamily)
MASPSQTTGPTLVSAAAPGTFAEAYRTYAARVARWVRYLGGVECDLEDVVQEVFLVVSRKWSTFREDGNFTVWLFGITRKMVANQRRRLRWRRLWAGDAALACLRWEGLDPDAELERKRVVTLFHRALDRLPEKQRTVFVLYELEGMPTPAIAELTQRNLSTVKVQLIRAREHFMAAYRRLLNRKCAGEGIGLSQLAQRVVAADAQSTLRLGKKPS